MLSWCFAIKESTYINYRGDPGGLVNKGIDIKTKIG